MNKKHEFTLQIIICTYNRTEAAIRCIKSALPLLEFGVGIAVHSNSPDQKLRYFMQSNGLSKYYGEHITNMGGMGNLRSIMKIVDSKYVMMMSDEDELKPEKASETSSPTTLTCSSQSEPARACKFPKNDISGKTS
mgnify:CR=1 FL=1